MKFKKIIFVCFVFLFVVSCKNNPKYISSYFSYMDTSIFVKIYDCDDKNVLDNVEAIYKEYHELTDKHKSYKGVLNVYDINNTDKEVDIDSKLYDVINYGIEKYKESDGRVNIAFGNVIDLWSYYKENKKVPKKDFLLNAGSIDINNIVLSKYKIKLLNGVKIDLGAISKGYATEMVGSYLESIGYRSYLINAGGNVKVGNHYSNMKYKIGIENPNLENDIYEIVNVTNKSVITSGGYHRFTIINNKKYHHIIDPSTFFPADYIKSVTVICDNSAYGDFLSTMLFLMPFEEGFQYIDSIENVEAIWYIDDGNIKYSNGFDKYEKK